MFGPGWRKMAVSTLTLLAFACGMVGSPRPQEADGRKISPSDQPRTAFSPSLFERGLVSRKEDSKLHVQIVKNDFCKGSDCSADKKKKVCTLGTAPACGGALKDHRALGAFHMFVSGFSETDGCQDGAACKPSIALSGWNAFRNLELRSITCKESSKSMSVKRVWTGKSQQTPSDVLRQSHCKSMRGTFLLPEWYSKGWKEHSPGFVFWYTPGALCVKDTGKANGRLFVGADILQQQAQGLLKAKATKAHIFAHKYFSKAPGIKDGLKWHAGILLEWEDAEYTTVLELAWLNGLGGYNGKSSYYPEKLATEVSTELYATMLRDAPAMDQPWDETKSEIRVLDVESKTKDDFLQYMNDNQNRYVDPEISHSVDLSWKASRSRHDILSALLNYNSASPSYVEWGSGMDNCQTFAADFMAWLTDEKYKIATPVLRPFHRDHRDYFNQVRTGEQTLVDAKEGEPYSQVETGEQEVFGVGQGEPDCQVHTGEQE